MYILVAAIGFAMLSVVSIFDKYILSKKATVPSLYTFFNSIFYLVLGLLLPFIVLPGDIAAWAFAVSAGFFEILALWLMYKGVEKGEVSHVGPLVGAVVPLFTIFIGRFFLHEILSFNQYFAVGLLVAGSLLIAFEKRKKGQGFHAGTFWGFLAGLAFASSLVSVKFLYLRVDFITGIILAWFFSGVCGLFFLFSKSVRGYFKEKTVRNKNNRFIFIAINMVLGTVGVILVQWAISLGSVTVVNSLEGVRYGLLVLLVAILSNFFPKIFKEEQTAWEWVQEALAVLLIAIGLIILI